MPVDKLTDTNTAIQAYGNSMKIGQSNGGVGQIKQEQEGTSFADFLMSSVENSVETMREGERMSAKAVTGEADITDVVQAVTQAELALQTVVSVRDRLVSAYQEIMRTQI